MLYSDTGGILRIGRYLMTRMYGGTHAGSALVFVHMLCCPALWSAVGFVALAIIGFIVLGIAGQRHV